jgi:hypothetical protein
LKSFVDRRTTCFPGIYIDLRLAKESDILPAAELCYRFSTESVRIRVLSFSPSAF